MMKISELLRKCSNLKNITLLFLFLLIFIFVIFPYYESNINNSTNENIKILDVRFGYNIDQVTELFKEMGENGRAAYFIILSKTDMIYPIIYGSFLILLIAFLLDKIYPHSNKILLFLIFPIVGMVFDYLENFNTLYLLNKFPNITTEEVTFGSLMTQLKWVFILFSIALIVILLITLAIKDNFVILKKFLRKRKTMRH